MVERRALAGWIAVGITLAILLPIAGNIAYRWYPDYLPYVGSNVPLHAVLEAIGGLIALAIAGILRSEYERKKEVGHYPWLAAGLLGMGVLDLFHAAALPGNTFVWLHSCATFVGGIWFALIWFSRTNETRRLVLELPWASLLATLAFSIVSGLAPDALPLMHRGGQFTPIAMFLNIVGGAGFFVASAFFVRRYWRKGEREDWLFAVHAGLFGAAGILFRTSSLWDGAWWWWHYLRLAAYAAALLYALRSYLFAERHLRQLNQRLSELNQSLDRTIEVRTAKLRASEERFQLALRGTSDGLWDWNVITMEVYYAPRFKELLGYTDEEFPNVFESFESHLHPDDHDPTLAAVQEHLQQHVPYDVTYRLQLKDGTYRWFRARGQAIWNEEGQATRMAGSITDITDERRQRERFRLTVEASPTALLVADERGTIILANSRVHRMFGYEGEELIGRKVEALVPRELREKHVRLRAEYFQAPTSRAMGETLDLYGYRKDGSQFPLQIGLGPTQLDEGPAVICGIVDISDQRRALEALQQAKEAAESANMAKSSFLANMSHEIRTPMNGIVGMSQLLSHTQLESHQREYLNTIDESAHILMRLLNDILDFSKIEAGKLELESIDFRLSEYVGRATQMLGLRAAEKGIELACRIAPDVPDHLRGDPGRLQQILVNLINNAIKFTEVGEIFVDINLSESDDAAVHLHFAVKDTGIGIAPTQLDRVFSAFEQAESSTTRRFGGTGLGLAISKQLVEMMQGRIWVESELQQGSAFHFTARFELGPAVAPRPPAALEVLEGLPILVVDDNRTNRRILAELLIHWRMAPELAESAQAARAALARNAQGGRPFGLILLDQAMPLETGLQFAASLRATEAGRELPIILIASAVEPADVNRSRELNIARVMSKPVVATDLLNEILRLFSEASDMPQAPAAESPRPVHLVPRRVLLVEDNEINRRVAVGLLESRGHQVRIAENGAEAVERLEQEEFDVVLMDMQMPVMDGYEATRRIRVREREAGGHVPIVAMTAEALKGDRERCLAAGMDDYLSKPVTTKELYPKIERFPAICLAAEAEIRPAAAVPAAPSDQANSGDGQATEPPGDVPVIDWDAARQNIPGGKDMFRELAVILRSQSPQLLQEMTSALQDRDANRLRRAAHTLKGAAGHFAAHRLTAAAGALEQLGRDESWENADELLSAVRQEAASLLQALQSEVIQDG